MIFFMTKELQATRNVPCKICSYVISRKPHEKYESCQANNVRRPQPRKCWQMLMMSFSYSTS